MADRTTLAGQFFEGFRALDSQGREAFLKNLFNPADPQFETDWLDFKAGQWQDRKRGVMYLDDESAKCLWGKALSGFANTGGGVLVWGIDARKKNDVDAATGFAMLKDPLAMRSRLHQLHHQATDPPVLGVEVETWEDSSQPGFGVVVCYVPQSLQRPHYCRYGDKQFYIRTVNDFVVCPVSLLRHLFYPYASVDFRVQVAAGVAIAQNDRPLMIRFEMNLTNQGTATAFDTYVGVDATLPPGSPYALSLVSPNAGWNYMVYRLGEHSFFAQHPIHPGTSCPPLRMDVTISTDGPSQGSEAGGEVVFRFTVLATNCERKMYEVRFSPTELASLRLGAPVAKHAVLLTAP